MCGIAGIATWRGEAPDQALITAMCDAMTHRGPDSAGYLVENGLALGMRRLAIIDLAGGHQPIFNEDRSVAVFFNGEIYNYLELRAELEAKGHRFETSSDTEVLVHLYEEEGDNFARRLNGMFAVALYDRRARRLVLARDQVGIKPLYFALDERGIIFGSEVKVVLASRRVQPTLDVDALGQFLAWEYVPGAATLMREIRRLEPATVLTVDLQTGKIARKTYWDALEFSPSAADIARSEADWVSQIDETVRAAVRRQMIADVPLGAFLSGGVDSSLVVAHMGDALTYSIGFDDPSYNEVEWSKRVAKHLGVRHTVEVIRPDVRGLFDHLMNFMDDPIGDFSIFPTYLVSKLAARDVKVVLSGDGGDELFGGYETYLAQQKARQWQRIPAFLRHGVFEPLAASIRPRAAKKGLVNKAKRFIEGASYDEALGHARWRLFAGEAMQQSLLTPATRARRHEPLNAHILALAQKAAGRDAIDRGLYVDLGSYMVDNCLTKVDRMSMACSIEARVPLLDREVVELAYRLPSKHKLRGGQTKVALKAAAARHVPHECIYRSKQGFSIPIKNWLKGEFAPLLDHHLSPERVRSQGLFDPAVLTRLRSEHDSGSANHSHLLWALLVFDHWQEKWKVAA
jgi:asparagine synthase (glutamine-hydrolysing)